MNLGSSFLKLWDRLPSSSAIPKKWLFVIAGLSFIGFLDAFYLTVTHVTGEEVVCSVVKGCNEVLQSSYAVTFGVPNSLLGSIYYVSLFGLAVAALSSAKAVLGKYVVLFPVAGFLASIWFLFLQLVVIKALCLYCLISIGSSFILIGISLYLIWRTSFLYGKNPESIG